jgi:hypothetical protein
MVDLPQTALPSRFWRRPFQFRLRSVFVLFVLLSAGLLSFGPLSLRIRDSQSSVGRSLGRHGGQRCIERTNHDIG